jgi:hypothetical protein
VGPHELSDGDDLSNLGIVGEAVVSQSGYIQSFPRVAVRTTLISVQIQILSNEAATPNCIICISQ